MSDLKNCVEQLIQKAAKEKEAHHALNFSQAACNAANALRVLKDLDRPAA